MIIRIALWKFVQFLTWGTWISHGRIRFRGMRNLPPPPFIVASNHQSYLDPIVHGTVLGLVRFMARKTLFANPIFGGLIRLLGAFELDRHTGADLGALKKAVEVLKGGESLVLFPEGTRSRDGSLGAPKPGVALIAARAGVPVVPAVIDGTHLAWPRGRILPGPAPIQVAYGKPLMVADDQMREFQDKLLDTWKSLLADLRRSRF